MSNASRIRKVFLVGDSRKGTARHRIETIVPWLKRRVTIAGVDLDQKKDLSKINADLLLVFGGDGSILSSARRMGKKQIPTIGVNLGRLGFLAALSPSNLNKALEQILDGHFHIEERLMLRCRLRSRGGKVSFETLALNDAVVAREIQTKMITVELAVGQEPVIDYRCDGIIVATPTGATGYSLSAGGPILDSKLDAFVVTPICPHTLTNRPLVVPSDRPLKLSLSDVKGKGVFTADGQEWRYVGEKDELEVYAAKERFQLMQISGGDFYSRLHTVLGWRGKMA